MRLTEAIAALCDFTLASGLSAQTAAAYRNHLGRLLEFLSDVQVNDVTAADLQHYAAALRQRQRRQPLRRGRATDGSLSPHSINSYLRGARRLFRWLQEEGHITANPALKLRIAREDHGRVKAAAEGDVHCLLDACAGPAPQDIRDRAIIAFLWSSGCRVGGVVHLAVDDVDLTGLRASVLEKGRKRRMVFFEKWVAEALEAWQVVRPETEGDWFFTALGSRNCGRQLSASAVSQIFKRRTKEAAIHGRCNPHSLLHAFAIRFLRKGGPLPALSQLMGHADVTTTIRFYGQFAVDDLDEQYRRFGGLSAR